MSERYKSAGALRQKVVIETKTESRDSYGQVDESWETLGSVWADVRPRSGSEFYAADQVHSNITHLVELRHHPGLTSSMRLRFDGRTLNVGAVMDIDGRRRRTQALCIEKKAGAS